MPDLNAIRRAVTRHVEDDGRVRDTPLQAEFPLTGTIGNVVSLTPPQVELLDGRTIRPRAYVGPVPVVGQTVLVIRVAKWALVVTGIEVI